MFYIHYFTFIIYSLFVLQRKYEEELDGRVREKQRLENKVKAMSEELMKGNEIIKKLQGEIKNYHAKVIMINEMFLCPT